ncbi:serine hydrolase domain-containing protein [Prevotella sp. OH937_COT-195]|uniref:serine hydrolase domain-containing protein n=1 Tax=Prevotella sp. OH937_COT-195 TaxID=2491051 RepID=UPI001F40B7AC|nr:serine hydrolase domain-containing protein [Prevotella sp. OH937_COT-195]
MKENQIHKIFEKTKSFPNGTQMSIAFIENGKSRFYGIIKQNDTIRNTENKDKVFEIGSISKIFTATLLADAILERKIKMTDDINKFYPYPFKDNVRITFGSLSNHTSGMEEYPANLDISEFLADSTKAEWKNPFQRYGYSELEHYLRNQLQLCCNPNKPEYLYSNFGTGLLGYTLCRMEKCGFAELISGKIFRKYKMNNSYTDARLVENGLVYGISRTGVPVGNWIWDSDVFLGSGGILSSANDLACFLEAQFDMDNKELAITRKPTFKVNDKLSMALGWHIVKTNNENELYWHNGGTGGFSSSMVFDINKKNGVIILSNVSFLHTDAKNVDVLCFEIMEDLGKE